MADFRMSDCNRKKSTLLVVDDEKNYRIVISRMLENEGYRVLVADGPEAAMSILQREPVALVLTDLQMPGNRGLDFCRQARRQIGDVPLVVFSADSFDVSSDELAEAGICRRLVKPFDNQFMIRLVAEVLEEANAANWISI